MKLQIKTAITFILLASVCFGLTGCSWLFGDEGYFRSRSNDYLKADSLPPLNVPENVDKRVLGQVFVVPEIDKADFEYPKTFEAPRPQALSANVYSEKVKIQRLGEDRWIFLNTSPSEVWPRVRNFLNSAGLSVATTDAQQGLIETAWLQFTQSPDVRQRFLIKIEQGVQPDSTEIHVLQVYASLNAPVVDEIQWPESSMDSEREAWMIQELASSLADEVNAGSASLLAQTIGGDSKVAIVSKGQEPVLRMELEMLRAWATLSVALQQEGLRTLEENVDSRLFYVDYRDPDEGEGFFRGWFSGDEEYPSLNNLLSALRIDDNAENRRLFPTIAFSRSLAPLENAPGFIVIVSEVEGAIEVSLRDTLGKTLEPRDARDYLGIIRRNLI